MIKRFSHTTFLDIVFSSCLLVSLLVVILNPSNPTLDGPAHLYNAHNINYILSGNEFINHYFTLNKIPVANLTDHYLLALFMSVFSWQTAEKLVDVIYLLSFSLLFRKLICQWNPASIGLSIFAIPFSFSFLYYIGFYNFCLSFPILFGIIIYYRKHFLGEGDKPSSKNYFILCLLVTLLYFTNGLAFLFAGLALVLFELPVLFRFFSGKLSGGEKITMKRFLLFALIWIPGLFCFLLFLYKVPIESNDFKAPFLKLLHKIHYVQPLVVYTDEEDKYTKYIFYLICIALFTAVYFRIRSKIKFKSSDVFLLLCIITFACYLIVPDGASVGMMTIRFCYYCFIFLLLWIATQQGSKVVTWIVSVALMAVHFTFLFKVHQPVISSLNKEVESVRNAGNAIKPNSIVLVLDNTGDFSFFHFPDYMGIDKPLVIIGNYEPNDGWFATTWNNNKMPGILLDGRDSLPPIFNIHWKPSAETKPVDYVFVYGNYSDIQQHDDWKTLNGIIQKDYKLIYTSTDNRIHIFALQSE